MERREEKEGEEGKEEEGGGRGAEEAVSSVRMECHQLSTQRGIN